MWQFLQQKHEARRHCWRRAHRVIHAVQPAPPDLSPRTVLSPLFTVLTSQDSDHRSPRSANLGVQQCDHPEENACQDTCWRLPMSQVQMWCDLWASLLGAAALSRHMPRAMSATVHLESLGLTLCNHIGNGISGPREDGGWEGREKKSTQPTCLMSNYYMQRFIFHSRYLYQGCCIFHVLVCCLSPIPTLKCDGTCLVVQWLRIRLPMQGT